MVHRINPLKPYQVYQAPVGSSSLFVDEFSTYEEALKCAKSIAKAWCNDYTLIIDSQGFSTRLEYVFPKSNPLKNKVKSYV